MSEILLHQRLRTGGVTAIIGLVALIVVGMMATIVSAASSSRSAVVPIISYAVPILMVILVLLSLRVDIMVVHDARGIGLEIRYGFGLLRQRFAPDTIVSSAAVDMSLVQMGGWGYRGSLRLLKYAALATRRGPALELNLSRGRRFIVTVDNPVLFVTALGR